MDDTKVPCLSPPKGLDTAGMSTQPPLRAVAGSGDLIGDMTDVD